MSEGRTAEPSCADIVERNLPAIAELCRRFGVRRLDLFGSAATGRFDPQRSDLDFLVEFEPEAQGKSYFRLLEEFEKLFGRKVDLLTEPGLENHYLRRRTETERRILFPTAMISNQAASLLWDARCAAERIIRFTAGRSYDDYLDDDMLRAAVERQFEIIGEALSDCGESILLSPRDCRICRRSLPPPFPPPFAGAGRVGDPRLGDDRSPDRLGRHSRRPSTSSECARSDARNSAASIVGHPSSSSSALASFRTLWQTAPSGR